MSFARWGVDGSGVYLFASEGKSYGRPAWGDVLVCCECSLETSGCHEADGSMITRDTWSMIAHLVEHARLGTVVPLSAVEAIASEKWRDTVLHQQARWEKENRKA